MHVFKLKLVIIIFSESYIIARGGRLLHARAQSYSSSASTPSLKKHFSDSIQLLYGGMACKSWYFYHMNLQRLPPLTCSSFLQEGKDIAYPIIKYPCQLFITALGIQQQNDGFQCALAQVDFFFPLSSSTAVKNDTTQHAVKKKKSCSDLVSNCYVACLFSTRKSTGGWWWWWMSFPTSGHAEPHGGPAPQCPQQRLLKRGVMASTQTRAHPGREERSQNHQPAVTGADFTLIKREQRGKPTAPEAKSVLFLPRGTPGEQDDPPFCPSHRLGGGGEQP